MKSIDIINVTGLLSGPEERWNRRGVEQELREKVRPRFLRTIAPTPMGTQMEHPRHAVERAVCMIEEAMRDIEQQFGEPKVLLVGRSYGALIALLAAIRMDFQKILKAILIEGPLHPDVSVKPPSLIPPLKTCGVHYKARPGLMNEAMDRLQELGTSRLILVQSGKKDSVVPAAAQVIPGDFEVVEPLDNHFSLTRAGDGERGLIVKLPPHLGGSRDGMKKLLPEGYRNHLFWGDEKMAMILKIIESAGGEW